MLQCDICACLLCVREFPGVCTEDGALHLFACPWVYDVCFVCLPVCGAKYLLCVPPVYVCVSEHMHLRGCDSVSLGLMRCWRAGGCKHG